MEANAPLMLTIAAKTALSTEMFVARDARCDEDRLEFMEVEEGLRRSKSASPRSRSDLTFFKLQADVNSSTLPSTVKSTSPTAYDTHSSSSDGPVNDATVKHRPLVARNGVL